MPECCSEPNCRRKQPMMLMRSDFEGVWYVVTRWKEREYPGTYVAVERHRLPDNQQAMLEGMRNRSSCSHTRTWIDDGARYCEECGYAV